MRNRHQLHCPMREGGDCCTCNLDLPELPARTLPAKTQKLKPRVLESIARLQKLVELDAPAVIIGAGAWNLFCVVLGAYGASAASTMIGHIRDQDLHKRAVCSHEDCINYVDRPSIGLCADCLKALDLPANAEEVR